MSAQRTRRAAYNALLEVERGAYANLACKAAMRTLDERDMKFATALFYCALEHKITIDFYIDHFARSKIQLPVRCALRLGVAQILYMQVPAHAAVSESVQLVKQIGKGAAAGFVNATLRAIDRCAGSLPTPSGSREHVLSIESSAPLWLVEYLIRDHGYDRAKNILKYADKHCIEIRANAPFLTHESLRKSLEREGIEFTVGRFSKNSVSIHAQNYDWIKEHATLGEITVIGQSSMFVCDILNAQPNAKILDACAAPGGKSLYISLLAQGSTVDSWDIHEHRVDLIKNNCIRLGIKNISASLRDASELHLDCVNKYDAVLVDAPCSGLGVISGKPDIKYRQSIDDIRSLSELQLKILKTCANYVAPGGSLVYSTCTISSMENQENVAAFLRDDERFVPVDIGAYFPENFDKKRIVNGSVQLYPDVDDVDGFFIAKFTRLEQLKK